MFDIIIVSLKRKLIEYEIKDIHDLDYMRYASDYIPIFKWSSFLISPPLLKSYCEIERFMYLILLLVFTGFFIFNSYENKIFIIINFKINKTFFIYI